MNQKVEQYLKSPCIYIPNLTLVLCFIKRLDELVYLSNIFVCKMRCLWQKCPPSKTKTENQGWGGGLGGTPNIFLVLLFPLVIHQ